MRRKKLIIQENKMHCMVKIMPSLSACVFLPKESCITSRCIVRCNLQNKQDLLIPDSGCQPWANSSTGQKEEQLTYICSSVFMKGIFIFSSCHCWLSYFNQVFNKFTSLSLWPEQMNCTKKIYQILWSKLSDSENMYDLRYKSLDNWTVHCSAKKPNE